MARTHARVYGAIWNDPDFRDLTAHAQRLYIVALSQPGVSFCGVVPFTARRWATFAKDTNPRLVGKAVSELQGAGFTFVDTEAEELWIRSFVRWDGVLESPNLIVAMWKDLRSVHSPSIRSAILYELPAEAWDEPAAQDVRQGFEKPPENPLPKGSGKGLGTPAPSPSPSPTPRGTRIPDNFVVDEEMQAWVKDRCRDIDWELQTENFVDWAKSTSSSAAVKKDWNRAWKTWMRREQDKVPQWARNRAQR